MARRQKSAVDRRVEQLAADMERIGHVSPTTLDLFEDWIDRLVAGESIETMKPEMDRLLEIYKRERAKRSS